MATVLIIEADADTGRLADYLLRAAGYATVYQDDPDVGVRAALENTADLILCDLDMPQADAFSVMTQLRNDSRWRPVPVVALARTLRPGDHEKIKVSGFAACLLKPLEPEIFTSQVEKFLPPRLRRPQPLMP